MMHILCSARFRILIGIIALIFIWQVFRHWPEQEQRIMKPIGSSVMVMVFYEALCPDSKGFIIHQLEPAYRKASEFIDYQLVPYGKATTTINEDGTLQFDCQHGRVECEANIYHACSIEAILDNRTLLNVIVCMIKDNVNPKEAMKKCTKENGIDWEPIQKCYDSPHGAELLKFHGDATHALRPVVSFIPTITLDGSQGRQASILKDLLEEVCKLLVGQDPMPSACAS